MNRFLGDTATATTWANEPQGNRLLRLRFPRDDAPSSAQLLANRLDAEEQLSSSYRYTVEVLSDDANLALGDMLGKLAVVDLVREDGTLRYFSGHVFAFSLARADGGFAFYTMVLGPWLDFLKLGQDCIAFQNLTLLKLTERVFAAYVEARWTHSIDDGDAEMTYVCQHNESHYNLLHRLWEARGWICHYEHAADGHTLWLIDSSVTTDLPLYQGRASMRFHDQGGSAEDDGIHQWRPWRGAVSGKAAAASFNFKNPQTLQCERASANLQGDVLQTEVRENTGAYPYKDRTAGDAQARLRIEEIDARAAQFHAEGNDRMAEPIRTFWLDEHFGTPNGASADKSKYLIVAVRHKASNNYEHGRGAESHYANSFTCVPKHLPWRPGRGFNSAEPRVYGVQTALVVGPPGEEIHTDRYGRVKLQFHWDRVGKFDDRSSPWVRVMTGWAGMRFGQISVPRVGMEVVVQFIDGNLARPLVIGAVYNEEHMPPWPLPDSKTQSGILTRSTKGGSDSTANALRFEDERGAEELWLHAEKDQRIEVEHDESHWVGNDRRKTVDHDETVLVKNDRMETVGHDEKITIHNNRSERVDHNEKISVGDNRDEDVGKNEHVSIGGNRVVRVRGMKSERVTLAKEETIGLGKALSIGAVYQTTVGGAMNTTVAMAQTEEVGLSKKVIVGQTSSLSAGTEHRIVVGNSMIRLTATRIEIVSDEVIVLGRTKVQVHGDDIDWNPSKVTIEIPSDESIETNDLAFEDRFTLTEASTGEPLPHTEYAVKRETGEVEFGTTDDDGNTHLLTSTPKIESIEIYT